jgi:alkylation response protein AidB-like acyl-CoA dehydrogenase
MFDLLLTEEETMIAAAARDFLAKELPLERLRPKASPRNIRSEVARMVALGWIGVGLPESVGGSAMGLSAEMLVHRECGRYLASPSFLATVLAAHVASHVGNSELAKALVTGKISAALALCEAPSSHADSAALLMFDWNGTDPLLVWNDAGMGLFSSDSVSQVLPHACLDNSITLQAGFLAIDAPQHWVPVEQAHLSLRAEVLLAASLSGLAEHACDITIEHVKTRRQFGVPVGAFQAVKHRCADMALVWRASWYQTSLACLKVDANSADAVLHAASAKLTAARAAHDNGKAALQMHGGIGFQAECDVHWFIKRAHVYDQVGGSMGVLARRIIAQPSPLW